MELVNISLESLVYLVIFEPLSCIYQSLDDVCDGSREFKGVFSIPLHLLMKHW